MVHAWDPSDWHGTSLQNYDPNATTVSDFCQAGLSINTPSRLKKLFKEHAGKPPTLEQLQQAALESESDTDDME
jgi:hypothetical protein